MDVDAPDPLPYDPIQHLRTDGVRLLDVFVDHGFDQAVPSCPGWDLGDLAAHIGGVWSSWFTRVEDHIVTSEQARGMTPSARPGDDLLLDWASAAHNGILTALIEAPSDQPVWTWTGAPRDIEWLRRRMVQETAVHRWDAANAVGLPYEIPTAVAADGIDEFLMWFAGRRRDRATEPVGGTVHLHCTDTDAVVAEGSDRREAAGGEWLVTRLENGRCDVVREHAKGDAAIRGRAHDLLLWCWGRTDGPVEILGDAAVAERFRAFANLD